jgi:flagellar biosynthesis/type III secretory pathway protein FliH
MKYEKDLMASWDEYSIRKTIENERKTAVERAMKEGREEGREEGIEKKSYEVVKNLLSIGKFTIAEIANFASVSEFFVRKVKKGEK